VTRNQAILIRAFCLWTFYIWGTRIWNILRDEKTDAPFKIVHSILAIISVAFAAAVLVAVKNIRRTGRAS
jgi:uncharacterized protein with PQ loop repeat